MFAHTHTHKSRDCRVPIEPKGRNLGLDLPMSKKNFMVTKVIQIMHGSSKGHRGAPQSNHVKPVIVFYRTHTQHIKTQAFSVAGVFLRSGKITAGCCIELQTSSKSIEEQLNRFESYRSYGMALAQSGRLGTPPVMNGVRNTHLWTSDNPERSNHIQSIMVQVPQMSRVQVGRYSVVHIQQLQNAVKQQEISSRKVKLSKTVE